MDTLLSATFPRNCYSGSRNTHRIASLPHSSVKLLLRRKHGLTLGYGVPMPKDALVGLVGLDRPTVIALVQFDLLAGLALHGASTKGRSGSDQSCGKNVRRVGQPVVGLSRQFCQPLNIGHLYYLHRSSTMSGIQFLPGILFLDIETR